MRSVCGRTKIVFITLGTALCMGHVRCMYVYGVVGGSRAGRKRDIELP